MFGLMGSGGLDVVAESMRFLIAQWSFIEPALPSSLVQPTKPAVTFTPASVAQHN
jgi:hypothetical protein